MDHRLWRSELIAADVKETRAVIASIGPIDWLVVDNYGIDVRWEAAMREACRGIAVIDDLANRDHDADVLIDQNLVEGMETRYGGRVSANCVALLGPRYALLRDEFRIARDACVRDHDEATEFRILAFFGGGDTSNETGKFLSGWRESTDCSYSLDVVLGASNPNLSQVRTLTAGLRNVRVHAQTTQMARLMATSDYAFGASGSSNWERFCLGLRATIVSVAENQIATARALQSMGLVDFIGTSEQTNETEYASALSRIRQKMNAMVSRDRLMNYVDGLGTSRVAATLVDGGYRGRRCGSRVDYGSV